MKENKAPLFQTQAWSAAKKEITRSVVEVKNETYKSVISVCLMNTDRGTFTFALSDRTSSQHSCWFSSLVCVCEREPLRKAQTQKHKREEGHRWVGVWGPLSGCGQMAWSCGYRIDQDLFCGALVGDQGERVTVPHTQSLIVSDDLGEADEEMPSEVTHPPKTYFPYNSSSFFTFKSQITAVKQNPCPCCTCVMSWEYMQQRHLLY